MIAKASGAADEPGERVPGGSRRLLECLSVAERGRALIPWTLVAASVLLVVIVLYVLFGAHLPVRHRLAQLEAELHDVYAREARLQTRLSRENETRSVHEQQLAAFRTERDALARRLEQLERELTALRGRPRR
jgi:septal ring factor EnvC (AmiA/AmiB activator)